jgi:hypothetical protein
MTETETTVTEELLKLCGVPLTRGNYLNLA